MNRDPDSLVKVFRGKFGVEQRAFFSDFFNIAFDSIKARRESGVKPLEKER